MGGIPVVTVTNDPFGWAVKTTLEYLQRFHAKGTFQPGNLPALGSDVLRQTASGRLFMFTYADPEKQTEQTRKAIIEQLQKAHLIEPVGRVGQDFRLTGQGLKTIVDVAH